MKKLKSFAIAGIFIISGFVLGACSGSATAKQNNPLKIWFENENGKMETYCLVDEKTGVNYVVVSGEMYSTSVGVAITPRLNTDGSPYVSK